VNERRLGRAVRQRRRCFTDVVKERWFRSHTRSRRRSFTPRGSPIAAARACALDTLVRAD
jgi:hypothetical protein